MGRVSSTAASTLTTAATQYEIQNISVTQGTETQITFPLGTLKYFIQFRGCAQIELRASSGDTNYWTIEAGNDYESLDLTPTQTYSVFCTSSKDGILEVISWS